MWLQLHQVLLDELRAAGKLQLDTGVVDGSHVRALKGCPYDLRQAAASPAGGVMAGSGVGWR